MNKKYRVILPTLLKRNYFVDNNFLILQLCMKLMKECFLQVLSATVCMLDVSVLAYPWTMYNQIIWPAWRESLWYSKLIVFFCTYYVYQYSVYRKLNLTVILYVTCLLLPYVFFISNIVSNIDQKELKSMYLNDVLYTTFK